MELYGLSLKTVFSLIMLNSIEDIGLLGEVAKGLGLVAVLGIAIFFIIKFFLKKEKDWNKEKQQMKEEFKEEREKWAEEEARIRKHFQDRVSELEKKNTDLVTEMLRRQDEANFQVNDVLKMIHKHIKRTNET